jgi:hypothetical protein
LGFSGLSSHSGCRILTPRSIWGVIIVCELHGFPIVVISVRSLRNDILSGIVLPARQHLDRLRSASLTSHSSGSALMSQETLRQFGAELVLHASVVGLFIPGSNEIRIKFQTKSHLLLLYDRNWPSGVDAPRSAVIARLAHH